MKNRQSVKSPRRLVFGTLLIGIICAAFSLSLTQVSASGDGPDKSAGLYDTNVSGLTYGSGSDASSWQNFPDLVAAVATNGESGYVYFTDLEKATQPAQTPQQAVQLMAEHNQKSQTAFTTALKEELGDMGVTDATVDYGAVFEAVQPGTQSVTDSGSQMATRSGSTTANESGSKVITSAGDLTSPESVLLEGTDGSLSLAASSNLVQQAIAEATMAVTVTIPVYESDGVTVIGELRVGSF